MREASRHPAPVSKPLRGTLQHVDHTDVHIVSFPDPQITSPLRIANAYQAGDETNVHMYSMIAGQRITALRATQRN